jgi:hypothetical protein
MHAEIEGDIAIGEQLFHDVRGAILSPSQFDSHALDRRSGRGRTIISIGELGTQLGRRPRPCGEESGG